MFLDLVANFCILFTFAILTYIPFQKKLNLFKPIVEYHPFKVGILSGLTGCLLMLTSISISEHVIVDGRMAVISLSGILGGPLATFISASIIGLYRVFIHGYSINSLIAGANTIFIGIVISLFIWKKPMTYRSAPYYFAYSILQTSVVMCFLNNWGLSSFPIALGFIVYSTITFSIVFLILKQLSILFKDIQQIEKMSVTDYLTGLNNNRKFQEYAQNFLVTNEEFSLILLDIDHFKKVNDTYGHPVGDEVLKELGLRLKDATSFWSGIVSRNGGEEFSVLLQHISAEKSVEVGEAIRHAIECKPFRVSTGEQLHITISGGICSYPENGKIVIDLYKAADNALYIAKSSGRNKIVHINDERNG